MNLTAEAPARTQDADDTPALDAGRTSRMAATLLRRGCSPESVREYAASRPRFAYMWDAIAGAMTALADDAPAVPAQRTAPAPETAPS